MYTMKNLLFLILFFTTAQLYSQQHFSSKLIHVAENKHTPCQTAEELKKENEIIAAAKKRKKIRDAAKLKNGIPVNQSTAAHPLFIWPMKISESYDMQYKYFVKGNFVDENTNENQIRDFGCGSRTYDGHDASDISLFPFAWRMMDKMHVYAVAAAPGEIIFRESSGYDKNCEVAGTPVSNRIYIEHADGSTTRYHHFKQDAVTNKQEGDMVEAGEFLGFIGSSGRSSGPHLHFAVYDNNDNIIEPYFIPGVSGILCTTPYSTESWWQNQPLLWDAKINRIMTHSAIPAFGCWDEEAVYAKNYFLPGDNLYTGIAITESSVAENITCAIYMPNGTAFDSWTFSTNAFDVQQYEVDGFSLPSNAPTGTWQVRATYRGNTYYHHFTVGCPGSLTSSGTVIGSKAYISGNTISSTAAHNTGSTGKVMYQAQNSIEFKPGFHAITSGGFLKTRLAGCNYTE